MKGMLAVFLLAALLAEMALRLTVLLICALTILPLLMILFEAELGDVLEPTLYGVFTDLVKSL